MLDTMLLGEGERRVGEACWSNAQCRRSQSNSYCSSALVCVCVTDFHNIDGKCSRSYWQDLGLENWELLLIALVLSLFALTVFVGCVYYVLLLLARRHRRTLPQGDLVPIASFVEDGKGGKTAALSQNNRSKQTSNSTAYVVQTLERRQPMRIKAPWDEDAMKERCGDEYREEEEEDEDAKRMKEEKINKISSPVDTIIIKPTKFILPLDYNHRLRRGQTIGGMPHSLSSDMPMMRPGHVVRSSGFETSSVFHDSSRFSWSSFPSEFGASTDTEPDWYQPNRRQFRRPIHRGEVGKTCRPLLLRTSTFSESDES